MTKTMTIFESTLTTLRSPVAQRLPNTHPASTGYTYIIRCSGGDSARMLPHGIQKARVSKERMDTGALLFIPFFAREFNLYTIRMLRLSLLKCVDGAI